MITRETVLVSGKMYENSHIILCVKLNSNSNIQFVLVGGWGVLIGSTSIQYVDPKLKRDPKPTNYLSAADLLSALYCSAH